MDYQARLYARLIQVGWEAPGVAKQARNGGGERGIVRGLSRGANTRLIRYLATIRRPGPICFLTLTYGEWPADRKEWKRHLNAFLTAMRYNQPRGGGVWRQQFQSRGAPHFHILLWLDGWSVDEFKEWAVKRWLAIIGHDSPALRQYAVDAVECQDIWRSGFYLALHHGTERQNVTTVESGRMWGVINPASLQRDPLRVVSFSEYHGVLLRRLLRSSFRSRHRKRFRASLYFQGLLRDQRCFSSIVPWGKSVDIMAWVESEHARRLSAWPGFVRWSVSPALSAFLS